MAGDLSEYDPTLDDAGELKQSGFRPREWKALLT